MNPVFSSDDLRSAVARLPDNCLSAARQSALCQLLDRGLPTPRQEDWKYTDLAPLVALGNEWLKQAEKRPSATALDAESEAMMRRIDATWLVIADGFVRPDCLATAQAAGIDAMLLSEAGIELQFDAPLSDLNTALLVDGIFLRIPRQVALQKPIGIMIVDRAADGACLTQARIEIEVESKAIAEFVECHLSTGTAAHYANSIVNMRLGDRAEASYLRIQSRASRHHQTTRMTARLARDAVFNHGAFDLGGGLVRNDLCIDIEGPGVETRLTGAYLAADDQHVDNHTRVDHRVGPARSIQHYRGIAAGNGRCVWNGKAIVHVGADGTDAQQANHNLLLSDRAEVDAKPELEIYADDVKCSHGTTVGQLDAQALYYLQTRGIGRQEAVRLMTQAFVQSIVDRAPVVAAAQCLEQLVSARLGGIFEEVGI